MSNATKAQLCVDLAARDARITALLKDIEALRLRVSIAERNAPAPVRAPRQLPLHFELARAKAIASGCAVRISNI